MPEKTKIINSNNYSTYNQITKEYDVYILSNEEFDKLSKEEKKEVKLVVLKKKEKTTPPSEPPLWFKNWSETVFTPTILGIKQEISNVRSEFKQAIHELALKNNLKE